MLGILNTVLPVFLLVGAGYAAARSGALADVAVSGVMAFAVRFAVPALLFAAMARLDVAQAFDPRLLAAFYAGAFGCFALGLVLARTAFARRPGEAVAIGFAAMFSNTVLLGLPILDRGYGEAALTPAFSIVAVHAPINYLVGIVAMEICRRDGASARETARRAARAIFSNAIAIGIFTGLAVNLSGLAPPGFVMDAVDMMADAALPTAVFALGGALTRYRLRADLGEAAAIATLSTLVHPAIAWVLATQVFALAPMATVAVVVLAAMPPGMNTYVFAAQYGRAEGAAASGMLLGTAVSVLTAAGWLWALGM
jgi:predicted permease